VNRNDFQLQYIISSSGGTNEQLQPSSEEIDGWNEPIESGGTFLGVNRTMRNNIVARMAFRAGIVKMEYPLYRFIWALLIKIVAELMGAACDSVLMDEEPFVRSYINPKFPIKPLPKKVVPIRKEETKLEVIQKIPPLPYLEKDICCPLCRLIPIVYTLSPNLVELAAKHMLNISPDKVYGIDWHIPANSSQTSVDRKAAKKQDISNCLSQYVFVEVESTSGLRDCMDDGCNFQEVESEGEVKEDSVESLVSSGDDESYVEESDDEDDEFLFDDEVDVPHFLKSRSSGKCQHPNGFVPVHTVPSIVM
jgi:hypothetical protein